MGESLIAGGVPFLEVPDSKWAVSFFLFST
jgi:hypothetical protein